MTSAPDPTRTTLRKQTPLSRGCKASILRGRLLATWLGVISNSYHPLEIFFNWAVFTPDFSGGWDVHGNYAKRAHELTFQPLDLLDQLLTFIRNSALIWHQNTDGLIADLCRRFHAFKIASEIELINVRNALIWVGWYTDYEAFRVQAYLKWLKQQARAGSLPIPLLGRQIPLWFFETLRDSRRRNRPLWLALHEQTNVVLGRRGDPLSAVLWLQNFVGQLDEKSIKSDALKNYPPHNNLAQCPASHLGSIGQLQGLFVARPFGWGINTEVEYNHEHVNFRTSPYKPYDELQSAPQRSNPRNANSGRDPKGRGGGRNNGRGRGSRGGSRGGRGRGRGNRQSGRGRGRGRGRSGGRYHSYASAACGSYVAPSVYGPSSPVKCEVDYSDDTTSSSASSNPDTDQNDEKAKPDVKVKTDAKLGDIFKQEHKQLPKGQLKQVLQHQGPKNAWRADGSPNFRVWEAWWGNRAYANGHDYRGGKYCVRTQLGIYCHRDDECEYLHSCAFCRKTPHSHGYLGCPLFASWT